MKILRRSVFALLCSIILVCTSVLLAARYGHHQSLDLELWALLLSELGILIWCTLFLSIEPKLARAGLIVAIILLGIGILSGFTKVMFGGDG